MPESTRALLLRGIGLGGRRLLRGQRDARPHRPVADRRTSTARSSRLPAWTPVVPPRLLPPDEDEPADVFAAIRPGDILVHHPYEIVHRVGRAVHQPRPPTIRTSSRSSRRSTGRRGDSPIVQDLIRAAEQGKQVVVLVEIKARFDEEANIVWARKLEQAGAHVVYGLVGLKTHSKMALVVRREGSGLRRYVHIGTGNYNPKTARLYTDLGLLTCRPELGADVTDLFNYLTGLSRQQAFRRLLVAPDHPAVADPRPHRPRGRSRPGRSAGPHRGQGQRHRGPGDDRGALRGEPGGRRDRPHRPRQRAHLQPGVPGVSERIRVRSIIGEFLEHSRILGFANGGRQEWYIGSADLMERNLDRRVEAVFPIEDLEAQAGSRRSSTSCSPTTAARGSSAPTPPGAGPRR